MGLARLVVIEGPDLGHEFDIPLRGGGIGRGDENVVQLSDMAVSRSHCMLELRGGKLAIIDDASRNRTLVNGEPVSEHVLIEGDEIVVGKTRLAFLPSEGGIAILRQSMLARVTMEVSSRELLVPDAIRDAGTDGRARRHLAAIASLGDGLRMLDEREELGRASCAAGLTALAADRVFLLLRDTSGRMSPSAAAISPDDPEGAHLALPREVVDKVMAEGKAIAMDVAPRAAVAAPLFGPGGEAPIGLIYADRRAGLAWDHIDLMAAGCLAHLISAALAGLEVRDALSRDNLALVEQVGGREFIGSSERARMVLQFVSKVAPSDATVLITGESGSGKEMVARALHRQSRRSRGPCVAVNCAALTETLIESELFGHEKGAFTGATDRKLGRFETADKGTLFLDEVGELPLNCQTKFLRVLEEQMFERVGGTRSIGVDVRVIAATNRDLGAMVRLGGFREDLYYRLSVIHTIVPPLRERAEDIPELAEYFLAKLRHQVARRIAGFAPDAIRALMAHSWPGNVRELKNAVERAIVLGEGELIHLQDLPPHITGAVSRATYTPPTAPFSTGEMPAQRGDMPPLFGGHSPTPPAGTSPAPTESPSAAVPRSLRELEREGIVAALAATNGNKAQAAAILEIDRSTLYKKIKDYGI